MHASIPTTSGPLTLSRPNTSGGFLTPVMTMLTRSTVNHHQTRLLNRSSSGLPLSTDHSSMPADRRGHASTGHLLLSEDDFMRSTHPSQDDPFLGNLQDSEDEDDADKQGQDTDITVISDFGNVSTQGRVLQVSTRKSTTPDPNALYSPTKPGRNPTTPDPNAMYSPTCLKSSSSSRRRSRNL